jgi:hypothetical protein
MFCLVSSYLCINSTATERLKFHTAQVSEGPLLFLINPQQKNGTRVETLYLIDPQKNLQPKLLWQDSGMGALIDYLFMAQVHSNRLLQTKFFKTHIVDN